MTKVLKQQALNDTMLLREDRGPVAVLILNRPDVRNSLSLEMIGALHGEIQKL
jgi:enoyl-CoA hydratase/carnithine racemase